MPTPLPFFSGGVHSPRLRRPAPTGGPRPLGVAVACLVAVLGVHVASVRARTPPPAASADLSWAQLRGGIAPVPSLVAPHRVAVSPGTTPDPFWGPGGLWARPLAPPASLGAPAGATRGPARGPAAWDPSSRAFFASFAGLLVRVDRDLPAGTEGLVALLDGVQGRDLDVRAAAGLAVSREPDDTIVLHRFAGGLPGRRVLLRGPGYFEPRLSPDGARVLLSRSHPRGGRMVIVDLRAPASRAVRDIGQGYGPSWHPAGDRVVFAIVQGRSQSITASELWMQRLADGRRVPLTASPDLAEIEPAVSPDGHFVAFTDARTGRLLVGGLPARLSAPPAGTRGGAR